MSPRGDGNEMKPTACKPFHFGGPALAVIAIGLWLAAPTRAETLEDSLHRAAADGDLEIVKSILANGAKIEARNEQGATPLLAATKAGCAEVVGTLLDHGADSNARLMQTNGSQPT